MGRCGVYVAASNVRWVGGMAPKPDVASAFRWVGWLDRCPHDHPPRSIHVTSLHVTPCCSLAIPPPTSFLTNRGPSPPTHSPDGGVMAVASRLDARDQISLYATGASAFLSWCGCGCGCGCRWGVKLLRRNAPKKNAEENVLVVVGFGVSAFALAGGEMQTKTHVYR